MTSNDASLHLYGSFDLLNQLKKARLPLSRGEALLSPYLELGQYTRTKELVITDAEIDQEMNRQYQALPSHISQLLSFEDYQKQADKLMPAITEAILASRKAGRVSESGQYSIDKVCKVDYMSLCNSALSHYGWQTLAENYTGL